MTDTTTPYREQLCDLAAQTYKDAPADETIFTTLDTVTEAVAATVVRDICAHIIEHASVAHLAHYYAHEIRAWAQAQGISTEETP